MIKFYNLDKIAQQHWGKYYLKYKLIAILTSEYRIPFSYVCVKLIFKVSEILPNSVPCL